MKLIKPELTKKSGWTVLCATCGALIVGSIGSAVLVFSLVSGIQRPRDLNDPQFVTAVQSQPDTFEELALDSRSWRRSAVGGLSASAYVGRNWLLSIALLGTVSCLVSPSRRVLTRVVVPLVAGGLLSAGLKVIADRWEARIITADGTALPTDGRLLLTEIREAVDAAWVSSLLAVALMVLISILLVITTVNATRLLLQRWPRPATSPAGDLDAPRQSGR